MLLYRVHCASWVPLVYAAHLCRLLSNCYQVMINLLEQIEPFEAKYKRHWTKGTGADPDFSI